VVLGNGKSCICEVRSWKDYSLVDQIFYFIFLEIVDQFSLFLVEYYF
jgi:hypothetical protein